MATRSARVRCVTLRYRRVCVSTAEKSAVSYMVGPGRRGGGSGALGSKAVRLGAWLRITNQPEEAASAVGD